MSVSTRPSVEKVQRSLIVGGLTGLLLGCILGMLLSYLYILWYPPVYSGGAFPSEMTDNYQHEYFRTVVDSYLVNRQPGWAQERLKSFEDPAVKIRKLGQLSADFVANGQAVEAQAVNDLAAALKVAENWPPETISTVGQELTAQYQGDSARIQALTTYVERLGQVPLPAGQEPAAPGATPPVGEATVAPPPAGEAAGFPWQTILICLLVLIVLAALGLLLLRILGRRQPARRPAVVWEGEGPPPLKQWTGTYRHGQENYDEFFTIETESGDFLGESGIGILETIPNTNPKQVVAFDVGLFDKTDITTLSRVIMSEYAYNDPAIMAKIEANPQAEAILAGPDTEFAFETSALRVLVKILDVAYGEGNTYFDLLKVNLAVFLKEGADLRIGTMDVPEQFR